MENPWLTDRIIYCERNGQAFIRRACRPLEAYLKRLEGHLLDEEWSAAESTYLNIVPGGATCECPACRLRAPGSPGILWAVCDDNSSFPNHSLRNFW